MDDTDRTVWPQIMKWQLIISRVHDIIYHSSRNRTGTEVGDFSLAGSLLVVEPQIAADERRWVKTTVKQGKS
jgi:hypothetical protein